MPDLRTLNNDAYTGLVSPGIDGHAGGRDRGQGSSVGTIIGRLAPTNALRALWALLVAIAIAMGISAANIGLWQWTHPTIAAPDAEGEFTGVAYNAFGRWDSPLTQQYPTDEAIHRDMSMLASHTRRLRTYSASEMPQIPGIAANYGLKITQGIWLDLREDNNQKEIAAAVKAANEHRNIERLMVGNETILSGQISPKQMIGYLTQVRSQVGVPVSTAEPWHVWLRYPELADHVDYIAVHLLPYWEGVPLAQGLEYSLQRFEEVKKRFPGKHVVIGEIGWPSQGDRFDGATASRAAQATFIREFLAYSKGRNLDYFLMEAIDQPWKRATEGRVGSYWGVIDSEREMKFPLTGPIESDPNWETKATLASLIGLVPMIAFLFAFRRLRLASRLFYAALIQSLTSLSVWMLAIPTEFYLRLPDWIGIAVLLPTLSMMVLILLANGFEFAEMFWSGNLRRTYRPEPLPADQPEPRVSIHLACCNEPPDMVIGTINSLLALDYRNFEVLVIDNNTRDEALWRPVQEHIARLDDRFRFFHLPSWPGYKAGALNFALEQTDPQASIIGVIDADYEVRADWLSGLVSKFNDPKVAVVQAPQAHRDWQRQVFRRMMNFEYDGFFRVGMHHRNERDAIIQHGTMSLIRASALNDHGRWSEWCICEDTELGLRLMQAGLKTVYVDEVMGQGLTPDSFSAFRKQRRRWAQGAMQILKAHARALFLGRASVKADGSASGELSRGQRYHFVAGWMSWFGDAMHLLFAFGAMFWTIGMMAAPHLFSLPIFLFMLPVFIFFVGKAVLGPLLYWRRVPCSLRDVMGSALAGMALSHGIAMGVFTGLFKRTAVFEITEKAGGAGTDARSLAAASTQPVNTVSQSVSVARSSEAAGQQGQELVAANPVIRPAASAMSPAPTGVLMLIRRALGMVREEAGLFVAMMFCIVGMLLTRKPDHFESELWMWILALQSVPYLAALICAWLSVRPERSADPVQAPLAAPQPTQAAERFAEPALAMTRQ